MTPLAFNLASARSTGLTLDIGTTFGGDESRDRARGLAAWRGGLWFVAVIGFVLLLGMQAGRGSHFANPGSSRA